MHWFAEELKKAREAKDISLHTVASETNINLRILESMERGDYFVLPYAYMRAFVKEYASCIGLNTGETVQRFDRALKEVKRELDAKRVTSAQTEVHAIFAPKPRRMFSHIQSWITENIPQVFITSLGALVLIVVSWLFLNSSHQDTVATDVREVPFQQVLKESEQAAATATRSRLVVSPSSQETNMSVNRLILRGSATDSVWMRIVIDRKDTVEYLFGPRERKTWRANHQFSITIGNAGNMIFTLNDQMIGPLGKPGAVVRDLQLTQRELTFQE